MKSGDTSVETAICELIFLYFLFVFSCESSTSTSSFPNTQFGKLLKLVCNWKESFWDGADVLVRTRGYVDCVIYSEGAGTPCYFIWEAYPLHAHVVHFAGVCVFLLLEPILGGSIMGLVFRGVQWGTSHWMRYLQNPALLEGRVLGSLSYSLETCGKVVPCISVFP